MERINLLKMKKKENNKNKIDKDKKINLIHLHNNK